MGVVVESWWNGRHGRMNTRRARLCRDGDRWYVERVKVWGETDTVQCRDEQHAREVLAAEIGDGKKWRRLDHLYRR